MIVTPSASNSGHDDWQGALAARYPLARSVWFECFGGWFPILAHLLERLETAVAQLPAAHRGDFTVDQIRQKFGCLIVRLSREGTPEMHAAIDEAQNAANVTCEVCGAPGESSLEPPAFFGHFVTQRAQFRAYRLDMVVEGAGDVRLAIECDGDDFHGPDRWPADVARQRVLERAGWTFWRCFASTWQLHRDEVLAELVERLTRMGIEPLGAIDRVPLLVEKRVVKTSVPEPDQSGAMKAIC